MNLGIVKKIENIEYVQSHVFVRCGDKLVKLAIDSIVFAHTDSKNHCSIVISDGRKLSVRYSITGLLKVLDEDFFIQTHRSYIINWHKVECLYERDQIIKIQDYHIPIGRTFKEKLYNKIKII